MTWIMFNKIWKLVSIVFYATENTRATTLSICYGKFYMVYSFSDFYYYAIIDFFETFFWYL